MATLSALGRKYSELMADVDQEIKPVLNAVDIRALSRHNSSLVRYGHDPFTWFIQFEKGRFLNAIDCIQMDRPGGRVVDLGCLFPYLPIALARLGYSVTIVEKFDLYGPEFAEAIRRVASANNIEVADLDIVSDSLSCLGTADTVLLMAVVEHLIGSPRCLLEKVRGLLTEEGFLYFEVPNIAVLSRRLSFLCGNSPLPNYAEYFMSEYPYFGHNREMTVGEVMTMMSLARFNVEQLRCFDYNCSPATTWRSAMIRAITAMVPFLNFGSCISVKCRPQRASLDATVTREVV